MGTITSHDSKPRNDNRREHCPRDAARLLLGQLKVYIPERPSNDETYDVPRFGHARRTPLAQQLNTIGYYVATLDGPRASIDYYSAPVDAKRYGRAYVITKTPKLSFTKRETFGYGKNGHEIVVAQGQPYTLLHDSFGTTTVRLLSGQSSHGQGWQRSAL